MNSHASPQLISRATPVESFTEIDRDKIITHLAALPQRPDGQIQHALISGVLEDEAIQLDFVCNPVFIIGDGVILDALTAAEMLQSTPPRPSPRSARQFTAQDVIPCNVIILAMRELLNIIDGKVATTTNLRLDPTVTIHYQSLTPADIQHIENYYESLTLAHQRLFNLICRGSTGHILETPILLPSGYLIEKSYALDLLNQASAARLPCYCPNSSIEYTAADLTLCEFSQNALAQIQAKLNAMRARNTVAYHGIFAHSAEQDEKISAPQVSLPPPWNFERATQLQKIKNLMVTLQLAPPPPITDNANPLFVFNAIIRSVLLKDPHALLVRQPELTNADMRNVLIAAIEALQALDKKRLTDAIARNPHCTNVITIAGRLSGKQSSLHKGDWWGKVANTLGTVQYQPGWYIHDMLNKTRDLIDQLTPIAALAPRPRII